MSESTTLTVRVEVGDVELRRWEEEEVLTGGWQEPEYDHRPNAVTASMSLTILFGDGPKSKAPRRTKWLRGRAVLTMFDPTEAQWRQAEVNALADLRRQAAAHAVELPPASASPTEGDER